MGRSYYQIGEEEGRGYRSGTHIFRVKSTEGAIEYSTPQIVGFDEPYRSEIRQNFMGCTAGLEYLAVEMRSPQLLNPRCRGRLRWRGWEAASVANRGLAAGWRLWEDYTEFSARHLGEFDVVYNFVDGVTERLYLGHKGEPVLVAWGITS